MSVAPESDSTESLRRAVEGFVRDASPDVVDDVAFALDAYERDAEDLVGKQLGDFEIVRRLASGGMGDVFVAMQTSVPGRQVALKTLPGLAASPRRKQRFAREVAVVGRLDHPNIAPIFTADLDASTPYFAMKLIEGETLRERLQRSDWSCRDYRRIAEIVQALASALQHAHEHGVIHRDVKPGNIVLDSQFTPVLLDFGLARDVVDDADLTMSSDTVGTQNYMAPEQLDTGHGSVDERTDVYGLGVTLYECLAGENPFAGSSRAVTLARILNGDVPPLRRSGHAVPKDLQTICMKAIERSPAQRYASVGEFAADLEAFLEFRPIAASGPSLTRRARRMVARHRLPLSIVFASLLALVTSTWFWTELRPSQRVDAWLNQVRESVRARLGHVEAIEAARSALDALDRRPPPTWSSAERGRLERDLARQVASLRAVDRDIEQALDDALREDPGHEALDGRLVAFVATKLREDLEDVRTWLRSPDSSRWARLLAVHAPKHPLLDSKGRLEIDCSAGAAIVWLCPRVLAEDGEFSYVARDHALAVAVGRAPTSLEVDEGSYMLRAKLEGHADLEFPLLVRRRAVQGDRERKIDLVPLRSEVAHSRFRYVHAGYSLLGRDDPADPLRPDLTWVDGFEISTFELRREDLPELMDPDSVRAHPHLGFLDGRSAWFADRVKLPGFNELHALLDELNRRAIREGGTHFYRLPTPDEWERAARGADARRFPWGNTNDWKRSLNYWAITDADLHSEMIPPPSSDISPFGVRDMAGLLHEPCLPRDYLATLGLQRLVLRGGSYLSRTEHEVSTVAEGVQDFYFTRGATGLRVVRVPLPSVPRGPDRLVERFEYPNGSLVETPWRALAQSAHMIDSKGVARRFRIEDGVLSMFGYGGDGSPRLIAWRPLEVDPSKDRVRVRAVARVWTRLKLRNPKVAINLGTQPFSHVADDVVSWGVTGGSGILNRTGGFNERDDGRRVDGGEIELVLEIGDGRIVGFTLDAESGIELNRVAVDLPDDLPAFRYLGLALSNYTAPRVSWREVVVEDL